MYNFRFNEPRTTLEKRAGDIRNPPPPVRLVGNEFELSALTNDDALLRSLDEVRNRWGIGLHGDGTAPTGLEFVTPPAMGNAYRQMLREFCRELVRAGGRANHKSVGGHIHVDARDFTWHALRRMAMLWTKIDGAMLKMVPASRQNNQWCKPVTENALKSIAKKVKLEANDKQRPFEYIKNGYGYGYGRTYKESVANAICGIDRYRHLNFSAFSKYGTLEFRLWPGSVNYIKWLMRSGLSARIVEFALKSTDKLVQTLDTDKTKALHQVIGDRDKDMVLHEWVELEQAKFVRLEEERAQKKAARQAPAQ